MSQEKAVIKCSICGKERFLTVKDYKEIVEGNYLKTCDSCIEKAKSLGLPVLMSMGDHSKMLTYINDIRGVKNEAP